MPAYIVYENRPPYPARQRLTVHARRITGRNERDIWDTLPATAANVNIVDAATAHIAIDNYRLTPYQRT